MLSTTYVYFVTSIVYIYIYIYVYDMYMYVYVSNRL